MRESAILHRCMLALSEAGCVVARANSGQAWTGSARRNPDGSVLLQNARVFHGMPKGTPDIIGWTPDGRFLAVEVKTATGRIRPEQQHFIDMLNAAGGCGIIARSADEAVAGVLRK